MPTCPWHHPGRSWTDRLSRTAARPAKKVTRSTRINTKQSSREAHRDPSTSPVGSERDWVQQRSNRGRTEKSLGNDSRKACSRGERAELVSDQSESGCRARARVSASKALYYPLFVRACLWEPFLCLPHATWQQHMFAYATCVEASRAIARRGHESHLAGLVELVAVERGFHLFQHGREHPQHVPVTFRNRV